MNGETEPCPPPSDDDRADALMAAVHSMRSHQYRGKLYGAPSALAALGIAHDVVDGVGVAVSPDEPIPYRLCIVPPAEKSGLDLLSDWIRRDPSRRVLERIALNSETGAVTVELRGKGGVYTSSTQLTLDSALRTALMVAWNSEGK